MWDCHSCDPGSNPGPGVQPSVRIPTTSIIDHKNNKEHTINSETTANFHRQKATAGILDETQQIKIRYSCQDHYLQVYKKIKDQRKK